ncbi:MAG: TolC family protein, partial [Planctomycetota bacterium]
IFESTLRLRKAGWASPGVKLAHATSIGVCGRILTSVTSTSDEINGTYCLNAPMDRVVTLSFKQFSIGILAICVAVPGCVSRRPTPKVAQSDILVTSSLSAEAARSTDSFALSENQGPSAELVSFRTQESKPADAAELNAPLETAAAKKPIEPRAATDLALPETETPELKEPDSRQSASQPTKPDGDKEAINEELGDLIQERSDTEISGVLLPGPLESDASPSDPLEVQEVVDSIYETFPLLFAAYQENEIASGNRLSASGAFDTKFKATSEAKPLGFYETYRNSVGVTRPLFSGGDVFAGYKLGRGFFEPWFLERQSNDGGELSAGLIVPLMRDRTIDERRAELFRRNFDVQRAQPEIQAQLILFVRDGTIAYWKWIAAGQKVRVAQRALELAQRRNVGIRREVEVEVTARPVLQDNLRSIASREAKLVALERSLEQAAIKLSLFYRTADGQPLLPTDNQLANFPDPAEFDPQALEFDIQTALSLRPELVALDAEAQRVRVDIAEATNNLLPSIDATLIGSQDLGEPTSSKRDKSRFEIEAGLFVDVPIQLRKARGKLQASQGKLSQILEKRRFTVDKVRADVQAAYAAIAAALERIEDARESRRLANELARIEQRKFELESTGLLTVILREQFAIEAAELEVETLFEYHAAVAEYNAALARDGR